MYPSEKAVGPGFNPRPGLQTPSDYRKLIPDSGLHAILIPTRKEIEKSIFRTSFIRRGNLETCPGRRSDS